VRSSSGGSGERRLGVGAIPAKGGRGLDRIRSEGQWRRWGSGRPRGFGRGEGVTANSGEEARVDFGGARRKKRKQARGGGVRVGFIGIAWLS
jgi:hypothetical protein